MISPYLLTSFHFECLQAGWTDELIHSGNHTLKFSSYICDHYFNYLIPSANTTVADCLSELPRFSKRRRKLAVYVIPSASPQLESELLCNNFKRCATDRWFVSDVSKFQNTNILKDTTFESVSRDDVKSIEIYVDMFKHCYSGEGPNEVYTDLGPEYVEAARQSFMYENSYGFDHSHLLAYLDDNPVGMFEMFTKEQLAGIYSVGTVPELRGKGIGKSIMFQAAKMAAAQGATHMFFQTEKDSYNDRWYTTMGFTPVFDASYYQYAELSN